MKLQDQVCTEDQAKRLHELGVAQQGYYCYAHRLINSKPSFNGEMTEYEAEYSDVAEPVETGVAIWDGLPYACAFTVAELGLMLDYCSVSRSDKMPGHEGEFCFPGGPIKGECLYFKTEAEARAARLIMALEKGWTTINEVNARLCAEM